MSDASDTSKLRVLLLRRLEQPAMLLLERNSATISVKVGSDGPTSRETHLANAKAFQPHGIITFVSDAKIDGEFLDAAGPQVKVVSTVSVGTDHIDFGALKARNVRLGNTPGVVSGPTAEIALALALMSSRRIKDAMHSVYGSIGHEPTKAASNAGGGELFADWSPRLASGLAGKVVGVIGLGGIGTETAKRLRGFDVNPTILYTGSGPPKPDNEKRTGGQCEFTSLDNLLKRSDLIFVTCSLNSKTRGLIGAAQLALVKPSAVIINVARGPIIDTDALVQALESGKLAAAGLDVTDPEPLPTGHPLLGMRRVCVLPHMGTDDMDTMESMSMMAVENLLRGLRGKEMLAEFGL